MVPTMHQSNKKLINICRGEGGEAGKGGPLWSPGAGGVCKVDAYWWALMVALEACSPPKYEMLHTSLLHHILHGWLSDFARKTAWLVSPSRVVRASLPPRFAASVAAGQRSSPVY